MNLKMLLSVVVMSNGCLVISSLKRAVKSLYAVAVSITAQPMCLGRAVPVAVCAR